MVTGRKKKEEKVFPLHVFQGSKEEQLELLYNQWHACKRCLLGELRSSEGKEDIVFASGNVNAPIMLIGEAPGAEEERIGAPFVGASGRLLNQILAQATDDPEIKQLLRWYHSRSGKAVADEFQEKMILWRDEKFFLTNVVSCRPPENRAPTRPEADACWERLYNIIYIVDPVIIVCLGKTALEAVVRKQMEITKYRGKVFDVKIPGRIIDVTYPLLPIFHPSYLLRKADWQTRGGDFDKTIEDIRSAMRVAKGLLSEKRL